MAFCSFSDQQNTRTHTAVQNQFITRYLPTADGDSVKVYLYGLYLCESSADTTAEEMANELGMTPEQIVEIYRFWEELDIVSITSLSPLSVRYLSADNLAGKPKRYKPEKYTDFIHTLQAMRQGASSDVSLAECKAYFDLMEEYSIRPEAMLMIVRYCMDLKGEDISYRYILATAKNFAEEGYTTDKKIEKRLEKFSAKTIELTKILDALSIHRKPELEDSAYLKKWTEELYFDSETILFVAKKLKKSTMQKLDSMLLELYSNKRFSSDEIENYLLRKSEIRKLTFTVANRLGVYCQNIEPYIQNYVSVWLSDGFTDDTVTVLADFCFKTDKKSFESMHEYLQSLYQKGIVSIDGIVEYLTREKKDSSMLKGMLTAAGLNRNPNDWDKRNLGVWRSWGFSDEMITKAAEIANGKNSPIPYMNALLSSWKTKNIFTPDQLPQNSDSAFAKTNGKAKASNFSNYDLKHNYTSKDLENIIKEMQNEDF